MWMGSSVACFTMQPHTFSLSYYVNHDKTADLRANAAFHKAM